MFESWYSYIYQYFAVVYGCRPFNIFILQEKPIVLLEGLDVFHFTSINDFEYLFN